MNKIYLLVISLAMLTVVSVKVYAKGSATGSQNMGQQAGEGQMMQENTNSQTSGQQSGSGQGTQTGSGSQTGSGTQSGQGMQGTQGTQNGTGNTVQNQIKVQNQGEATQIKTATKEQQGTQNSQGNGVKATTKSLPEVSSSVAQKIQTLLSTEEITGGIGDQVREWAKDQTKSQTKIQEQINKVESKSGLLKSIFGPDYKSLNGIKKEMEQNNIKIQELEQLKIQLTNEEDITNVSETIALMQEEAISLQERINLEQQDDGAFGWLIKLFVK